MKIRVCIVHSLLLSESQADRERQNLEEEQTMPMAKKATKKPAAKKTAAKKPAAKKAAPKKKTAAKKKSA